jgi:outer membrane murein-binding lipoprotein Lpp
MSITTEEAEQMAEICDQLGGFAQCAAAIRSLAAERDALKAEVKKLRAELQTARRDALEKAARWHDEQAKRWQNTYVKETLSGLDMQAARVMCLERGGFHIESAAAIRALGEKE